MDLEGKEDYEMPVTSALINLHILALLWVMLPALLSITLTELTLVSEAFHYLMQLLPNLHVPSVGHG